MPNQNTFRYTEMTMKHNKKLERGSFYLQNDGIPSHKNIDPHNL